VNRLYPGQVLQLGTARETVGEYDGALTCRTHRREQRVLGDGD
jgi:hypothetical protein